MKTITATSPPLEVSHPPEPSCSSVLHPDPLTADGSPQQVADEYPQDAEFLWHYWTDRAAEAAHRAEGYAQVSMHCCCRAQHFRALVSPERLAQIDAERLAKARLS